MGVEGFEEIEGKVNALVAKGTEIVGQATNNNGRGREAASDQRQQKRKMRQINTI
jgi:hypothetical protein